MAQVSDFKLPFRRVSIDKQENPLSRNIPSQHSFSKSDLEQCASGLLFGAGNAQLPTSPLMMLDRIIDIQSSGGEYDRGYAIAEMDIDPDVWFFKHHFHGDPLMPGCFLIESLWQLAGFHMAWSGHKGRGRVLESGRTRFVEPVNVEKQTLRISTHIRKIIIGNNPICIADGNIRNNISTKCNSFSMKIGLFV